MYTLLHGVGLGLGDTPIRWVHYLRAGRHNDLVPSCSSMYSEEHSNFVAWCRSCFG
jgi:hypothetical protein